jgi:hypothetical protein
LSRDEKDLEESQRRPIREELANLIASFERIAQENAEEQARHEAAKMRAHAHSEQVVNVVRATSHWRHLANDHTPTALRRERASFRSSPAHATTVPSAEEKHNSGCAEAAAVACGNSGKDNVAEIGRSDLKFLNKFIYEVWPYTENALKNMFQNLVDSISPNLPALLQPLELQSFTLGRKSPLLGPARTRAKTTPNWEGIKIEVDVPPASFSDAKFNSQSTLT